MTKTKTTVQQGLTAQRRAILGSRPVKRLRRGGLVPGVVYGRNMEPVAVTVNHRELARLLHSRSGEHALVTLRVVDDLPAAPKGQGTGAAQAGGKSWEKPVLMQAIQHDPVSGHVVHVDFHAILLTERLKVKVPVILKGEPVGVKQEGGILEHFLREVEVECLPTEIPASVEHDVSAMTIGQTVHVRDLVPPQNTKITSDRDGVIASVQVPKVEKPEEEAAAVTEPEVIREKKEEGEEAAPAEAKGEKAVRPGASEGRAGEPKDAKDTKKDKEAK